MARNVWSGLIIIATSGSDEHLQGIAGAQPRAHPARKKPRSQLGERGPVAS